MKNIAALLTCHNRKNKTMMAITTLHEAAIAYGYRISLDVYLTDDGSTDGTSDAVLEKFPDVTILYEDGSLFWANGMRNSWQAALKKKYDGYLLLNDDVELYEGSINLLMNAHTHCMDTFGEAGIYIGATEDRQQQKLTYSGSIIVNKFLYTQKRLAPNGNFQSCDLANANIMLVPQEVVDKIGILSEGYSHGIADYDYTLTASKKKIPILVAKEYCGHCVDDHKDLYDGFIEKSIKERRKYLYNPTGLAYRSYIKYMRKFFPLRYPLVVFFGWFKLYFPKAYLRYIRER